MERSLWTTNIRDTACPAWKCPSCRKGVAVLVPKSLRSHQTAASAAAHDDPNWDPEWVAYTFTAWAKCSNVACGEMFALSGKGGVAFDWSGHEPSEDLYMPVTCHPMPDVISLPEKCPDNVATELRAAFTMIWLSPEAAAGRIRVSLECLMDYLGIKKRGKNKNGKDYALSLDARLHLFEKRSATSASHLLAVKWLGNSGSHSGSVSQDDLLNGLEVLEHVLSEVIDKRSLLVAKLAKKLTRKHSRR